MAVAALPSIENPGPLGKRSSLAFKSLGKPAQKQTASLDALLARPTSAATNEFVLMFDKSCPEPKIWYMMMDDTARHPRPLPKINFSIMPKLKDIYGYRAVVNDNKLFIIGGRHLQSAAYLGHCNRYDPKNNSWTRRSSMIRGRARFAAVVMDGCIYVCGGEGRGGRTLDSVECYDPRADLWVEMSPMPRARADLAACVSDNRIFVCGGTGKRGSSHKNKGGTNTFWHFDPFKDHWATSYSKSNMPWPKERHNMVAYKGTIYVLGGVAYKKYFGDRTYSEREDEAVMSFPVDKGKVIEMKISGTWDVTLPPMPIPRAQAATAVYGHNLFVIGGRSLSEKKPLPVVQFYNFRKRRWYHAFDLPEDIGTFVNMDVVNLRIPVTNKEFSPLARGLRDKWPLW